jgi:hypothetical protein
MYACHERAELATPAGDYTETYAQRREATRGI